MPTRPQWHGERTRPKPSLQRRRELQREYDARRGTAHERGYTGDWQKARKAWLLEHPLCVECEREGEFVTAIDVDHIVPHRGDRELFWDQENWQGLCKRHHWAKTGRGE